MQGELGKIFGLDSKAFELKADIIAPSETIDTQPIFRERRESNDGPTQSLLLLPRQ